ncbi:hypothetical protein, partial [Actinophytocola sp.]|uniref:hypothetical protein n=1 Tax=Actinophytocola sp. TaxID=1872138 RepID=UPI003899DB6B
PSGHGFRELPTSTVSDALRGKRPVKKDLLESLLKAWRVPAAECAKVVDAWQRINATVGQGPANAPRVNEVSPRELGVHPAISVAGAHGELPAYIPRDFDETLRDLIAQGVDRGCFVLLVGGSSWGKTRSLYEAVSDVVPDWWLIQPAKTQEIHDLCAAPTERTVLWLDEFNRYLGTDPPLLKAHMVTLVRTTGMIVVGTLWPEDYFKCKRLSADGGNLHAEDRRLLDFADVIPVPGTFSPTERNEATKKAAEDRRIEVALSVLDAGITQVLAAGPDLVILWEQAGAYGKAMISAAADARRLGVRSPLPAEVLTDAMVDYLTPAQRSAPVETWRDEALGPATRRLHGEVSALIPMASEQPGSAVGYVVADYLAQHIGSERRVHCPPDSLWRALVTNVNDSDDLRHLASTALARMRYQYAEQALRRLVLDGDGAALTKLVALLRRQDRIAEAITLVDTWQAAHPDDQRQGLYAELVRVGRRAEEFRQRAASDIRAAERLAELLADGGRADALRTRAAAGDAVALEDLAELLADRGCVDELRELASGGNVFVGQRLAELLGSLGREKDLQRRVDAGDQIAGLYLDRLRERNVNAGPHEAELAQLRAAADGGDQDAASELGALLFDARDQEALLAEVNAGTYQAVERYLALLTADPAVDRGKVRRILLFGLRADGLPGGLGADG